MSFRENHGKLLRRFERLRRQERPGIEPDIYCLQVLSAELLRHWCGISEVGIYNHLLLSLNISQLQEIWTSEVGRVILFMKYNHYTGHRFLLSYTKI